MQRRHAAFALLATLAWGAACVHAADAPVAVEGAWARAIVKGQDATGAFMVLTAREPLTLVGADSPAAGMVEIHQMKMQGDVMKMGPAGPIALRPGQPVKLGPGGYHVMLMDLKAPFAAGSSVAMTLRFRDAKGAASALPVTLPVALAAPVAKH